MRSRSAWADTGRMPAVRAIAAGLAPLVQRMAALLAKFRRAARVAAAEGQGWCGVGARREGHWEDRRRVGAARGGMATRGVILGVRESSDAHQEVTLCHQVEFRS